ncbi:MAG: patatin-like phospholipase family protein [Proteobacteria bacterium]|nr:patatin-like phospholipase family protein [Pseudomonadota bacterium]
MNQGNNFLSHVKLLLFVCLPALLVTAVAAGEPPLPGSAAVEQRQRLKVGLALGGGGARGISHIGVLRALEEHNIPIDCIVGTSMGSIIGGLYASGKTPDEIEQIVGNMDWGFALSDGTTRDNKPIRVKERQLKIAHAGRLGVSGDALGLPLAVLSGQNLNKVLAQINQENLAIRNFDNFPLPFRAVATDLATGGEYVISKGSISEAMRASMSVPGLLEPVELDGRLLVDGGMANNVPASVARELCGDIVIAVSVGAELEGKETMTSLLAITEQISSFLTWGNTAKTIESLSVDDLLIKPDLGDIGSGSFSRGIEGVPIGYAAANTALAGWKNTQKMAAIGNRPVAAGTAAPVPIISFVQLDNNTRLDNEIITAKLHIQTGEPLNLKLLNQDINKLYGFGLFDSVSWDYVQNEAGETGINIVAYQNPAKRNYMQFGLQLEHDSNSDSNFTLGMAYIMSNVNHRGGNLRLAGSLGENTGLSADFYQPIDMQGRYFINPIVKYQKRELNIFDGNHKLTELELDTTGVYFGAGMNFGTKGELRLGYERARGRNSVLSGVVFEPPDKFDLGELTFRAVYDNLDSYFFPRSGHRFILGSRLADEALGASSDYKQVAFSAIGARSWGKGALAWRVHAGYSFDDAAPIERAFELGGLGQLSGLATNQLIGQHLGFASVTWYRYLAGIEQISAFGGASLEIGNTWLREEDIGFDSLRTSGSIFVGADSPIGPLYLGFGLAEGGNTALYLYVGNPFDFSDGLLSPR